jgi:hypothetical protein
LNPVRLWTVNNPSGFSGSPVISADATVYAAGLDSVLYAFNPDGSIRWRASLPEQPIGPLGLGPQGTIYVTDVKAGVTAVNTDGKILWTYPVQVNGKPNHGVIVDPQGIIYYLIENQLGDILVALQPNGQLLWYTRPGTHNGTTGLRLSPDGTQIFIKDVVVNTKDGTTVDITPPTKDNFVLADQAHYLVGADGNDYLLAGHQVMQWKPGTQGFELIHRVDWNFRGEGFNQSSNLPVEGGVTARGGIWLFYSGLYGEMSVYWLDSSGDIIGKYNNPLSKSAQLVAVDGANNIYACRTGFTAQQGIATICEAYGEYFKLPIWTYTFSGTADGIRGAAMAPGKLYVVTPTGDLTAIGDSDSAGR